VALLGVPSRDARAQSHPDAHAAPKPEAAPAKHEGAPAGAGEGNKHEGAAASAGETAKHEGASKGAGGSGGEKHEGAAAGAGGEKHEGAGGEKHEGAGGEKHEGAGGEKHGDEADEHQPAVEVAMDVVVGSGRRAATGEEEAQSVTAVSSVIEASYGSGAFHLGVFVPFSQVTITRDEETPDTKTALGNLAFMGRYEREISPSASVLLGLTVAVPTAAGDRYAAIEGRAKAAEANEWAALTRAYAEDELFAPHRVCVVPAIGLERHNETFEFGGSLKMPMLGLEGGSSPSGETGESTSPVAVEFIPAAYAFYRIRPAHLAFGASAYAVYFAIDEVRAVRREEPKFQPVFEPEARVLFERFRLAFGYILPIGGRLGGNDRQAGGFRVAVGIEL
jgi:hypothetical protein